jgi:hypothetical protein
MNSKYIVGVIIVFIFSAAFAAGPEIAPSTNGVDAELVLSLELTSSTKKELQYAFELRNKGSRAAFYSANPHQVDGVIAPYISVDENDRSRVNVEWRVFDRDIVPRLENGGVNKTGVELKRLEPGAVVSETVSIKWPLEQTVPPLLDKPYQKLERRNVKRIRLTVGYFEEEEGILEFLSRKPFGWHIKGFETLEMGAHKRQPFFKIQKLLSWEVNIPEIRD